MQTGAGEKDSGPALDLLAARMGIEPEFRNARGVIVRAGVETKRSLLAAMGIEAADEAQAEAALDALDRAEWLRPAAPVQVLRADPGAVAVGLVLPPETGRIAWQLMLEDGTERSGQEEFSGLGLIGERCLDGLVLQRRRLALEGDLPWGYHRLKIEPDGAEMSLVVTPGRCWLPPGLDDGRRLWGIAVQLYLLRSAANWGIGDFGDLRNLVELAASRGADVIGVNPLHAMFTDDPEHASPYSPESRLLLNILNIDVAELPELHHCPEAWRLIESEAFGRDLSACRAQHLVDYAAVTTLKLTALEPLFEACRTAPDGARWQTFQEFRSERGEVLQRNCLFQALREHFAKEDHAHADWHAWPVEYQDPASPAVDRFATENRLRLDFLTWLQWVADEQLAAAAAAARERGMAVGLYRDLAVGADRAGAETWADAATVVSGAQVGAPPDIHNPNWRKISRLKPASLSPRWGRLKPRRHRLRTRRAPCGRGRKTAPLQP